MHAIARRPCMTTEEFLAWPGDGFGLKHQLIDGEVRTMAPAATVHGVIQARLAYLLIGAIRAADLDLSVLIAGAVVPRMNASRNVRVPDIATTATPNERGQQDVPDPVLLIEVLSPGNQDETRDNIRAYATLPSVQEIALIHSARLLAEVHRRATDGHWLPDPELVKPGERLRFATAALDCPLEQAYRGTWLQPRRG